MRTAAGARARQHEQSRVPSLRRHQAHYVLQTAGCARRLRPISPRYNGSPFRSMSVCTALASMWCGLDYSWTCGSTLKRRPREPRLSILCESTTSSSASLLTPTCLAYVIHIAVMFDRTRNTISLTRLAKEMKAARLIQGQEAAELDALLAEAAPIAEKVNILRHSAFAHRICVASRMMRFSSWPR